MNFETFKSKIKEAAIYKNCKRPGSRCKYLRIMQEIKNLKTKNYEI